METNIAKIAHPVLVTGATGFIGSRVIHKLIELGIPARALVLPGEPVPESWSGGVEIVRGGINDVDAVEKAASGAATMIHLVAVVSDWGDEKRYWSFTVEGSRTLFEQAVKNGSRVVLASSIAVYGDNIRKRVCHEETPFGKPLGPYSRTKQAQERLGWEYAEKRGMKLSVVRPANVYGPRSGPWLHDVADQLIKGMPALISGGRMNAGLAYVDNVADLLLLCGAKEKALGRVYNGCDGLDVTWRRYFTDLAEMLGARPPGSVPRPAAAAAARLCEVLWKALGIEKRPPVTREALNLVGSDNRIPSDRARAELGFEPRVSYEEGMERTREYIAETLLGA